MSDNGNFLNRMDARLQESLNHKGDFLNLLKHANYPLKIDLPSETTQHGGDIEIAHSTTVVAMRYRDGVMIAGTDVRLLALLSSTIGQRKFCRLIGIPYSLFQVHLRSHTKSPEYWNTRFNTFAAANSKS